MPWTPCCSGYSYHVVRTPRVQPQCPNGPEPCGPRRPCTRPRRASVPQCGAKLSCHAAMRPCACPHGLLRRDHAHGRAAWRLLGGGGSGRGANRGAAGALACTAQSDLGPGAGRRVWRKPRRLGVLGYCGRLTQARWRAEPHGMPIIARRVAYFAGGTGLVVLALALPRQCNLGLRNCRVQVPSLV
jgi:hypothetical protein